MEFIDGRKIVDRQAVDILSGPGEDYPTAPDVIDKNAAIVTSGGLSAAADRLVWPALLRKLDRLDPGFRA